jgi:MFS transporter, DHA2 family, multidrug resistance protein
MEMATQPQAITPGARQRATRKEWLGLGVLALPCLLYSMDLTVLNLAVPRISAALKPSGPELLWMVDIYGFLLAGFLIPMGSLGDRIGRRRLLLSGALAFGIGSIFAAFATTSAMLIAARALLGIAAATLAPSTLSLIRNMFLDPRQRTMAVSIWVTSFSAGAAVGPLLGGLLLQRFWWGSVFLLAVPVMVLLLILGPLVLPEFRDPNGRRVDLVSAVLSLAAVLLLVYGIKQFAQDGLTWLPGAATLAGIVTAIAFVDRQRRLEQPLVDLRLFRLPEFSAALAINLFSIFAVSGAFLFIAQYLQLVVGLSPLIAGLWTIPSAAGMVAGSMLAPLAVRRASPWTVTAVAMSISAAGFGMLTQARGTAGLAVVVVGSTIFALGVSPAVALATDLIVGSVPPEHAGMASGMSETSTELGGALGIAILGAVGLAVYRSQVDLRSVLSAQAAEAARSTLGGALVVADQLPAGSATILRSAARDAFTRGLQLTSLISAVICLTAAVMAARVARSSGKPV